MIHGELMRPAEVGMSFWRLVLESWGDHYEPLQCSSMGEVLALLLFRCVSKTQLSRIK